MNEFSIKIFAHKECPICEFPSAINVLITRTSMVLQCQTCKMEYFYKRIEHITNNLLEMQIQE